MMLHKTQFGRHVSRSWTMTQSEQSESARLSSLRSARRNQLFQLLTVHPWHLRHDPTLEGEWMSVHSIKTMSDRRWNIYDSQDHAGRKFWFDTYFYPFFVQGLQYLEDCQHLGHHRPQGSVSKLNPGAAASTKAIRNVVEVIRFQGTIIIEVSLGHKGVRIRIPGFIMRHLPGKQTIKVEFESM